MRGRGERLRTSGLLLPKQCQPGSHARDSCRICRICRMCRTGRLESRNCRATGYRWRHARSRSSLRVSGGGPKQLSPPVEAARLPPAALSRQWGQAACGRPRSRRGGCGSSRVRAGRARCSAPCARACPARRRGRSASRTPRTPTAATRAAAGGRTRSACRHGAGRALSSGWARVRWGREAPRRSSGEVARLQSPSLSRRRDHGSHHSQVEQGLRARTRRLTLRRFSPARRRCAVNDTHTIHRQRAEEKPVALPHR